MMRNCTNAAGEAGVAGAREEDTPRHHGRWYLVFHPAGQPDQLLSMPEIRWQTAESAERTLRTMSLFELRRRLGFAQARAASSGEPAGSDGAAPVAGRAGGGPARGESRPRPGAPAAGPPGRVPGPAKSRGHGTRIAPAADLICSGIASGEGAGRAPTAPRR